jgi:Flp pilus assembly protein TadD
MFILFFLLSGLLFLILLVGLIFPKFVIRWGEVGKRNRKRVLLYYGMGWFLCLILMIVTVPEPTPEELKQREQERIAEQQKEDAEKKEKVKSLITQAQKDIDNKKYDSAIKKLKGVFKYEKNNSEAKDLLAIAEKKEKEHEKQVAMEKAKKEKEEKESAKEKEDSKVEEESKKDKEDNKVQTVSATKKEEPEKKKEEPEKKKKELKKSKEEVKKEKVASLIANAKKDINNTNYTKAMDKLLEALSIDKNNAEAKSLLEEASEAQKQEQIAVATRDAEAYKASCESIPYNVISKSPAKYKGKRVTFYGIVTFAKEEGGYTNLIITTNGYQGHDDVVVRYKGSIDVYEDDEIIVYGTLDGEAEMTTNGMKRSVPELKAKYIDLSTDYGI